MSHKKHPLHMIGNAHIDPVWLWRFQDGLAEIKATFQSALDRIEEYDEFVFTCGCAMYYEWVENNCPPMFEKIRDAVKAGRWIIVGGMWIQPDCNMPSTESLVRQMLYSQNYFKEKFGITAKTGYNVDSFGHSSGLPRLLTKGGMQNYTYLRPAEGEEKTYPFADSAYRWRCGENEVLTYRLPGRYNHLINCQDDIKAMDEGAERYPYPVMYFYGVGNHGGGPTVKNINHLLEYRKSGDRPILFSDPDRYFDFMRSEHFDALPVYTGELQNHASGCYSANSLLKMLNRTAENRMNEAERLEVLSAMTAGHTINAHAHKQAWKKIMFNQFHDILCGCITKAATQDAYAFYGSAVAHGLESTNAAIQRISWNIDTDRGVPRTKDLKHGTWETDGLGTPIVVFNPLSYPVTVPITVRVQVCAAVTDESGNTVPHQMVRAGYSNRDWDTHHTLFFANLPAYGWRTYWVYREREPEKISQTPLKVSNTRMSNGSITVDFDAKSGEIAQITTNNVKHLGAHGCRTLVIDDSKNDTWAHGNFVFENEIGSFGSPEFKIIDEGECTVSLRVTQHFNTNTLERTYTLYPGDDTVHVSARLVMNEPHIMVKLAFDTGLENGEFLREVPGDILSSGDDGRENPMLRFMAIRDSARGLAVVNNGRYSASCNKGEMRMVAARTCLYGDHFGNRDGTESAQDIGEQEFCYAITAATDTADILKTADKLNTEFIALMETYHKGNLPQTACYAHVDANNAVITCIKGAEDQNGIVVRITETSGRATECNVTLFGTKFKTDLKPYDIKTFRLCDGKAEECTFLE